MKSDVLIVQQSKFNPAIIGLPVRIKKTHDTNSLIGIVKDVSSAQLTVMYYDVSEYPPLVAAGWKNYNVSIKALEDYEVSIEALEPQKANVNFYHADAKFNKEILHKPVWIKTSFDRDAQFMPAIVTDLTDDDTKLCASIFKPQEDEWEDMIIGAEDVLGGLVDMLRTISLEHK